MANEEHQDLTHFEKLKANSAGGRMENVMKGSIERFRSSTTRRKQEVAQLEDHSDEENSPVAGERASKDPTPRSRLMEHEDSSEINQPIWHSHPDILPPSEAQDSPEDLRGYASYVAGEVENDTKKPKVLDYFSTTSAYCFNDEKFRPIKSMEPGASRSPKASFDHEIEIDGERYAEDPDPTLHEKIDSKERKQRAKTAAKAKPKQPVKPKNELKAWEDDKDAASTASVLGDIVSGAATTLGLEQDKATKDREALNKLVQAKGQRPAAQLSEHVRGAGT